MIERRGSNGTNAPIAESPRAGTVLWLMGPTSAGKTTLGTRIVARLRQEGVPAVLYDGDEVRDFFGPDFGFGAQHRLRVVSVLAHLANKASQAGLHVIVAALTAGQDAREHVRANVANLRIGHVSCSVDACARRDPKGLYGRAKRGEIDTLIGFNSEYRAPDSADIVLDTETYSVDELAARAVATLFPVSPARGAMAAAE
jgi:adenylylsulfate kinase-like enzyme